MMESIKRILDDIFYFLKNPSENTADINNLNFKLKRLFLLFVSFIIIAEIILLILSAFHQIGISENNSNKINDYVKEYSPFLILVFGAFIFPFIEELVFRLYLRFERNYPIKLFIFLVSTIGGKNKEDIKIYIKDKWNYYYKQIFYLSAFIFSSFHLLNYPYKTDLLILAPILIAPQFIMGVFTAYLRLKNGFMWGYFLHAMSNFLFLSIMLMSLETIKTDKINISNSDYNLTINETNSDKINSKASSSISKNSINFENIK
jgi:hypothetical protein